MRQFPLHTQKPQNGPATILNHGERASNYDVLAGVALGSKFSHQLIAL